MGWKRTKNVVSKSKLQTKIKPRGFLHSHGTADWKRKYSSGHTYMGCMNTENILILYEK
jgi:hypothetical protein